MHISVKHFLNNEAVDPIIPNKEDLDNRIRRIYVCDEKVNVVD